MRTTPPTPDAAFDGLISAYGNAAHFCGHGNDNAATRECDDTREALRTAVGKLMSEALDHAIRAAALRRRAEDAETKLAVAETDRRAGEGVLAEALAEARAENARLRGALDASTGTVQSLEARDAEHHAAEARMRKIQDALREGAAPVATHDSREEAGNAS